MNLLIGTEDIEKLQIHHCWKGEAKCILAGIYLIYIQYMNKKKKHLNLFLNFKIIPQVLKQENCSSGDVNTGWSEPLSIRVPQ